LFQQWAGPARAGRIPKLFPTRADRLIGEFMNDKNQALRVGVIGCGAIAPAYLSMASKFAVLDIVACADLNPNAARKLADRFEIPRVMTVEQMLAEDSIDAVLNLTIPRAHVEITLRSLKAGKHVYSEKPLALTREEGQALLREARERGLVLGCAPDTWLGSGIQTARRGIDQGIIGRPVGFTAFFMCGGHEKWGPVPAFYYQPGGGPMMDMGPYYVSALLNLLGPVRRVFGFSSMAIPQRAIGGAEYPEDKMMIETSDHVAGVMEFKSGVVGTLITSFATQYPQYSTEHPITIFGEKGTLLVPDPNLFMGTVKFRGEKDEGFRELSAVFPHEYGRSVGLADMALAIEEGRQPRASGALALACLDIMLGFEASSQTGTAFCINSTCPRPEPMPTGQAFGVFNS
jgi:predicted dehydrogenase